MSVTTYVGFPSYLFNVLHGWYCPFKSLKLRWPLGTGLRNTIGLDGTNFRHILNDFLAFQIGDFTIPTGLLLFMALSCFVVWMFSRSRTGQAMQAVGNNPRFAESVGINVDKMRITGTVFSTVLGVEFWYIPRATALCSCIQHPPDGLYRSICYPYRRCFYKPVQDQPCSHRYLPVPGCFNTGNAGCKRISTWFHYFRNTAYPDLQWNHSVRTYKVRR